MGDDMPFILTKNDDLAHLDHVFAHGAGASRRERIAFLNKLRAPRSTGVLAAPQSYGEVLLAAAGPILQIGRGPGQTLADRLRNDWFRQPPHAWWLNWNSSPDEVMCRGIARALELSLGVDHVDLDLAGDVAAEVPSDDGPCWPIEFMWSCPHPTFQVWVTKRSVPLPARLPGDAAGQPMPEEPGLVTVTIATPGLTHGFIASCPADERTATDQATGLQFTYRLGLVDEHRAGGVQQLMHKANEDTAHLLIGDRCVETVLVAVPAPEVAGLGDRRPGEPEGPAVPGEGDDDDDAGPHRKHQLITVPMLQGTGGCVTVSPFNVFGGFHQP